MTDRIDSYLNGTLEASALTPEERARAEAAGRAIEATREFVAARPAPDLKAAVMSRIEEIGTPAPHRARVFARLAAALWTPRVVAIPLRPAYGLIAAAIVAAIVMSPPLASPVASPEQQIFVQFRLEAMNASTVRLAGSFTNWQPRYELHETSPGSWTVTLPLSTGIHDYVFIVDGQRWVADPYAPHVDDGFGGTNSRIALLAPDQRRS